MNQENQPYLPYSPAGGMLPREEMLEVATRSKSLVLGIPCEDPIVEKRISLVPNAVGLLVENGHRVLVERGAGIHAFFSDHDYAEWGAELVDKEQVMKTDILLKVAPLTDIEIDLLDSRTSIFSSLQLTSRNEEYFRKLMLKKASAIAFEYIQDKSGAYPVRRAMSEMAGNAAIMIAAEHLSHPEYGKGHMFGGFAGISPTEVVIIGAGNVAEYAARAALGMGAFVKIFDNSIYKLKTLQKSISQPVFTSIIQPNVLLKAIKSADVVVGALFTASGRTPVIVSEEMVSQMKPGSVIIDVSIDQGGCIETSHPTDHRNPVFISHQVTHYCVPNIASRFPHTASYALSNFLAPVLLATGEAGGIAGILRSNIGVRRGTYMFNGIVTNSLVSDYFRLPFQEIDLLMTAF